MSRNIGTVCARYQYANDPVRLYLGARWYIVALWLVTRPQVVDAIYVFLFSSLLFLLFVLFFRVYIPGVYVAL